MHTYLTTEEVADMLRTTPDTVRFWHKAGKGPASFKLGRRRLYTRADVEDFVRRARQAETAGTPREAVGS